MKQLAKTYLRKSEKYFKTDMVYLAHGGFWLTFGQAISAFSALIIAIAFANLVPPETYGTYKYILSIAAIFAIFSLPGMQTAISRAAAQGHTGIIHKATKQRVLCSFIGSIASLTGGMYYFLNGNLELTLALLVIAVTLPVFDTLTGHLAHFVGIRRFDLQAKYHALTQIISAAILIIALFFTNNLIYILLAYFLPLTITRAFIYWKTTHTITKKIDAQEEKQSLTYGKHLSAIAVLGVVAKNIDKVILWKLLGPAQLAVYAFAIALPEQIKASLKGVSELAFPKFATQTPEQIRENMSALWRKLGFYTLGILGISLLYILASPYIFKLLFPQYMESVIFSQILAVSLVMSFSSVLIKMFEAQKNTKIQYALNIFHPILQVVLYVILIPLFGILGAVLTLIISRIITTGLVIIFTFMQYKKKI